MPFGEIRPFCIFRISTTPASIDVLVEPLRLKAGTGLGRCRSGSRLLVRRRHNDEARNGNRRQSILPPLVSRMAEISPEMPCGIYVILLTRITNSVRLLTASFS